MKIHLVYLKQNNKKYSLYVTLDETYAKKIQELFSEAYNRYIDSQHPNCSLGGMITKNDGPVINVCKLLSNLYQKVRSKISTHSCYSCDNHPGLSILIDEEGEISDERTKLEFGVESTEIKDIEFFKSNSDIRFHDSDYSIQNIYQIHKSQVNFQKTS